MSKPTASDPTDPRLDRCAEILWTAWTAGERIEGLPDPRCPATPEAGWEIQRGVAARAGRSYGWKIAATSAAGQAHIGVDRPLPGRLFERFRHEPGAELPSRGLHMKVVEAEFAFTLARDVDPLASGEEVLGAVDALHLAVEIPDSRYVDFATVGRPALLADTACAGMFILGPQVSDWRYHELPDHPTTIVVNGEVAARGSGQAVLGDPATALRWLVGELAEFGEFLRAGDVVTTGTTTVPPTIGPGDTIRADFGDYGSLALSFRR